MNGTQLVFLLLIAAFMVGTLAGRMIERHMADAEARIAPAPTAVVPDTAQDHIRQYACFHALTTGNYLAAKGCV